jgi:hypothetical protein
MRGRNMVLKSGDSGWMVDGGSPFIFCAKNLYAIMFFAN